MARERTIGGDDQEPAKELVGDVSEEVAEEREEHLIWSLRPRTLSEYVGQTQVVESLSIDIDAASELTG